MNILITGVAGFIGHNLASALLQDAKNRVVGIDNFYSGSTKKRDELCNHGNFTFYENDIRDYALLCEIVERHEIEYILHLAAVASVQETIRNPLESHSVNIQGTLNILEAARNNHVKRVVFSSSAAVYGNEKSLPKNELSPVLPISPYGVEKLTGEYYMQLFHSLYGLETVCLRYFNVYGKGMPLQSDYSGVISIFMQKFEAGTPPSIFGTGEQYRDFVHVTDVVNANIQAMTRPGIAGEVFCIGTGVKTSINQLFELMNIKYNTAMRPDYLPAKSGDIMESVCENTKAIHRLGISTFKTFEEEVLKLTL